MVGYIIKLLQHNYRKYKRKPKSLYGESLVLNFSGTKNSSYFLVAHGCNMQEFNRTT
jgi:hypothetical protein